jgi:hypothetical protein
MKDVSVGYENEEPVLTAGRLAVDMEPGPLLRGRFVITTVRLFDFSLSLRREDAQSPLNIERLIDALARRDTSGAPSAAKVDIRTALLRRGRIAYDVGRDGPAPSGFDSRHIYIYDLNADLSFRIAGADSLNFRLSKMSLKERGGLVVERLSLLLAGNADSLSISNCRLDLPDTRLYVPHAGLSLAKAEGDDEGAAPLTFELAPSEICPRDLASFAPVLKGFADKVTVAAEAEADGDMNDFNLRSLTLMMDNDCLFAGQMSLKGVDRLSEAYLYGKVSRMFVTTEGLRRISANMGAAAADFPPTLARLGTLRFEGNISGFFDNLVAYGKLTTGIGSIQTDLLIGSDPQKSIEAYVRGRISSSELLISELFDGGNPFGTARFNASIDAVRPAGKPFAFDLSAGISEFDFRNYRYENLRLSGRIVPGGFSGRMELDDPNCSLMAEGMFSHDSTDALFDFSARLSHFRPDHLNMWDKLESPDISAVLRADFRGAHIDDMAGSISVDSISIVTAPSNFFLRNITIAVGAGSSAPDKKLTLESDLIRGEVNGIYSFATLLPGFMKTLEGYAPALSGAAPKDMAEEEENNFSLWLEIDNTEALSETLLLPLGITKPARITGHYNNTFDKFRLDADIPGLAAGKTLMENCRLTCENPGDHIDLRFDAFSLIRDVRNRIQLEATLKDNRMESNLHWANGKERRFETNLSASAVFAESESGGGLRTDILIHPSQIALNDSIWNIHESVVSLEGGKTEVSNFRLSQNDRFLSINGAVSDKLADTLALELNRIELEYIFDMLNIPVLQFGGEMSGRFRAVDLYRSRMIDTDKLRVDGFSFNDRYMGELVLSSRWDESRQGILLDGTIAEGDTALTSVNGYIYPIGPADGLDLRFDARNLNTAFLHKYLDGAVTGFRGRGTGHIRVFGTFDDVDLEGQAYIADGGIGIDFLNTYYTFSDTVRLTGGRIYMQNIAIRDEYGNGGRIKSANLRHRFLHDIEFDAEIDNIERMLVYNAAEKQNPNLYGRVFASGGVAMRGNEQIIDFDVRLRNDPRTLIGINFMDNPSATAYDFITFVNRAAPDTASSASASAATAASEGGPELRVEFQLDLTPDAAIEFMMDPAAGDKITGAGSGSLQISYGTKSDLKIYGTVQILKGEYNFSLQQLIHKNFSLREGSLVTFSGDPETATLNINAVHSLTANLGDLDPSLLNESPRTSVPVNCVMLIKGPFAHPSIAFDLELPGSNSELEQMVRSYVRTEDMLTRQIVYLLVLNTFHPSGFEQATLPNEFNALTSAALSSQISGLLNSITDKVRIGTNIRTGQDGFNDTEVEMLLSSQMFDNRLLFNGNFGYKSNPTVKNVFVGEFDLEYLLTPAGEFRLKAYNHANDMYRYLKQSLTTQGFGFMYKKDFSSLSELFARRPRPVLIQSEQQSDRQTK